MGARVIVVDDQKYLRDIMAAILDDAGYPALAMASPEEALRRLDDLRPEMIVLDMSLPGMSGLEFLSALRAMPAWSALPVVVVSGDPGRLVAAANGPRMGALTKPFDAASLVAEATRFLGPPALTPSL